MKPTDVLAQFLSTKLLIYAFVDWWYVSVNRHSRPPPKAFISSTSYKQASLLLPADKGAGCGDQHINGHLVRAASDATAQLSTQTVQIAGRAEPGTCFCNIAHSLPKCFLNIIDCSETMCISGTHSTAGSNPLPRNSKEQYHYHLRFPLAKTLTVVIQVGNTTSPEVLIRVHFQNVVVLMYERQHKTLRGRRGDSNTQRNSSWSRPMAGLCVNHAEPVNFITNCMKHSPPWEVHSHFASEKVTQLYWTQRFISAFRTACQSTACQSSVIIMQNFLIMSISVNCWKHPMPGICIHSARK
jgi:hypothetical protein